MLADRIQSMDPRQNNLGMTREILDSGIRRNDINGSINTFFLGVLYALCGKAFGNLTIQRWWRYPQDFFYRSQALRDLGGAAQAQWP